MTEQEIVNILKDNMSKGIAYLFLPEDVWEWIGENFRDPKLMYLAPDGKWESFSETDFDDYDNIVFALPDYYQVKEESKGEWVEFEINEGKFNFIPSDVNGLDGVIESWWNWQEFLTVSNKYHLGFTAFGGWLYEDSKTPAWFLSPQIENDNGFCDAHFYDDGECKPAIPIRIRFWREA